MENHRCVHDEVLVLIKHMKWTTEVEISTPKDKQHAVKQSTVDFLSVHVIIFMNLDRNQIQSQRLNFQLCSLQRDRAKKSQTLVS